MVARFSVVVDLEDRLIGIVGNEGAVWRPHITRTELAHGQPPWLCALTEKGSAPAGA